MSTILTSLRYTTGAVIVSCIISLIVVVGFAIYGWTLPKQVSTSDKVTLNKVITFQKNQKIVNWTFGGTAIASIILIIILYFMTNSDNKTS
jgi:hypothetical protein